MSCGEWERHAWHSLSLSSRQRILSGEGTLRADSLERVYGRFRVQIV